MLPISQTKLDRRFGGWGEGKGKAPWDQEGKGKSPRAKKEREKSNQQFLRSNSTRQPQTARTHARTKQNDFPVEHPPTSDLTLGNHEMRIHNSCQTPASSEWNGDLGNSHSTERMLMNCSNSLFPDTSVLPYLCLLFSDLGSSHIHLVRDNRNWNEKCRVAQEHDLMHSSVLSIIRWPTRIWKMRANPKNMQRLQDWKL